MMRLARRQVLQAIGAGAAMLGAAGSARSQPYPNLTPAQLGYAPDNPPGVDSPLGVPIDCVEGNTPACLAQEKQLDQLEYDLGYPQYAGGVHCFLEGTTNAKAQAICR
jgi:hypothetical protein